MVAARGLTDEQRRTLRRLALQLSVQMPSDRESALVVVDALRELVDFTDPEKVRETQNAGLKIVR